MHFSFINFQNSQFQATKSRSFFNKVLRKLGLHLEITQRPNGETDMITIEQRINLFHLLNQVLIFNVEGDIIELGCRAGETAVQIKAIIENSKEKKDFHVYDKFNLRPYDLDQVKEKLIERFKSEKLELPHIHEGLFEETLPDQLPEKIAFAHIDCGEGGDISFHSALVSYCLESVYPRLSKNAVCLMMDYHDVDLTAKGSNINPGVKLACDEFFKSKEEKMHVLYGNHYSHGYFRKI